ncbi:hypothetical protein [Synechococcus sp. C9]|uniref:hypothetical protein n=1 Tax=Synechococcus sp. C9 TaxID=102119 RepID=UPI001FF25DDC|nr:hypothetical protein [Synechococcus sp. C9]
MPAKSKFTIKADDLAKALEITLERLYEIIDIFDADPDDEWDLKEGDHFVWLSKSAKTRLFSEIGAYAIAKYLDAHTQSSIWARIKEFITRHKERLRNSFISQKVIDNSSSLTRRNNRWFVSRKETIAILCTSPARFNKAFEDLQRTIRPLTLGEDFDDFEGEWYYSLSGFERIARALGQELKAKDRREWCKAAEIVAPKTLLALAHKIELRDNAIRKAMERARRRDKDTCQITGQKPAPHNPINMTVHHIYSKEHFPDLAESMDNLITLTEPVHKEFHCWNGGFDKPCTIDDLINFVQNMYPEKVEAQIKLNKIKSVLGHHTPKT